MCAALAGEFLPEMELVGISTGSHGGAQAENVCAALEWCLQDGAAVVCMSMGVTCGLDLARMGTATRALRQAGCWVFCASSNGGKLTFPAAYPWTVGVKFDSTAREVQQVDPRWGCDVAVGLFHSQVLDKLAEEEPFFHARTNSLAVAMAASQVLQAGDVEHLPVKSQKLWVPDGNKAFQSWEKPVVRLLHSGGSGKPCQRSFHDKAIGRYCCRTRWRRIGPRWRRGSAAWRRRPLCSPSWRKRRSCFWKCRRAVPPFGTISWIWPRWSQGGPAARCWDSLGRRSRA